MFLSYYHMVCDLLLVINEFKVSETTKSRIEPKL